MVQDAIVKYSMHETILILRSLKCYTWGVHLIVKLGLFKALYETYPYFIHFNRFMFLPGQKRSF